MIRNLLLAAFAAAAIVVSTPSDAFAHGGTYRGPGDVQGPPDPGGPTTPGGGDNPPTGGPGVGPVTPGGNGPSTPGGVPPSGGPPGGGNGKGPGTPGAGLKKNATGVEGFDSWQFWWEYNKDRFLDIRERLAAGATTTNGGSFLVGTGRKTAVERSTRPTPDVVTSRIVPLLVSMLDEPDRDIVDSAVLALGRIVPSDSAGICIDSMKATLRSQHAPVRQSALLALGVLGHRDAVPTLVEVLGDTEAGRKLLGINGKIQDIERGFAAIALGYVDSPDTIPVLFKTFETVDVGAKTLRGSILVALGFFSSDRQEISARLLGLLNDEKLDEDVAGQIPVALARLGEPSAIPQLLKIATSRKTRARIEESAIIALGSLASAGDREVIEALNEKIADGDNPQARNFAIIAMGDIAERALASDPLGSAEQVAAIRLALFKQMMKPRRSTHEPWAALALSILGRRYPERSNERLEIAMKLTEKFEDSSYPNRRGAYAIALGIIAETAAGAQIEDALLQSNDDTFRGFCAVSLGMLRHAPAKPLLRDLVRLNKSPNFRLQVATGLGLMGDLEATDLLVDSFRTANTLVEISSLARAIGLIGDGRAVAPLEGLIADRSANALARGFGCVALGLLAEKTDLPWNARISVGINYRTQITALREVLDIL